MREGSKRGSQKINTFEGINHVLQHQLIREEKNKLKNLRLNLKIEFARSAYFVMSTIMTI